MKIGIDVGSDSIKVAISNSEEFEIIAPKKIEGKPILKLKETLEEILKKSNDNDVEIGITGYGSKGICEILGLKGINELGALSTSFKKLYPEVKTIIEIGKSSQKYILFGEDGNIADWSFGGKCAAGTGSFVEYMAKRLEYDSIGKFASDGANEENYASLSGRCTVFAESDLTHKQQIGTPKKELVAGANRAPVRNYIMSTARQKKFLPLVAVIGGMSLNQAFIKFCKKELSLDEKNILIPEHNLHMSALGAGMLASEKKNLHEIIAKLDTVLNVPFTYEKTSPLQLEKSIIMPPKENYFFTGNEIENAALGIDIGSVSTKAVLLTKVNDEVKILASHYRRTAGDPLAAVKKTIEEIYKQINGKYNIKNIVAGTTGSGRYLTGAFVGAELVKNEITAQAEGARMFVNKIDSIIELGGQDSKFIRCKEEANIDNVMNKACAAGTGALLERMASHLDIDIENFGDLALKAKNPPQFNTQCAVFLEQNLLSYLQNNMPSEELAAGACIGVVKSYMSKLVENRSLGERIVFQGAVAKNKGMIAAFETILDKKIIVPPFPHLTGPIGIASLAYKEAYEK